MTLPHKIRSWLRHPLIGGRSKLGLTGMFLATTISMLVLGTSSMAWARQDQLPRPDASAREKPAQDADSTSVAVQTELTTDAQSPNQTQETQRQKEQRLAVEQERAARGTTVKSLATKLAEAEKSPTGDPLQLTFDDLVFPMDKNDHFKRSMLSKDHDRLDQRKVSISGFIRPSARQSGLDKFVFVRDNMECCFGPGAALYDCILVKLADGQSTDYTVRPVTIEGDFYIKEFTGPNGKTWAIFRMKNGQVR